MGELASPGREARAASTIAGPALASKRTRLVSITISADRSRSSSGSDLNLALRRRLGPLDVLVLSAWCGLAGGLLEVGTRVLSRYIDPTNRLYVLSRHFLWAAPLSTLAFFSGFGLFLALATKVWPNRGAWFATRIVCFWAVLPSLIVVSPQVYPTAWVILALGIASLMASVLDRHATWFRHWLLLSFPALLGSVVVLATIVFGGDWLKRQLEAGRPLPSPESPNVLLVVLDTVRADRLSLYGYERPTTPALERLAKRGILFNEARATAPWTLASHASLFTGRWPHELGVKWRTPLSGNFPRLSEYLGSRGYATAGFVANTLYCSYETGLDRGFTHYEDYAFRQLAPFRTAWLVDRFLQIVADTGVFVGRRFDIGPFRPSIKESWFASLFVVNRRKDASAVNRAFVDWLEHRREPARPFFAFLNYYDAHAPYVLPAKTPYRFGIKPQKAADFVFLVEYWQSVDKLKLRPAYRSLARDSYDNCIAYLDQRLGELFDDLKARGLLDRTLVIVTADHGEGLGDHGLFDHGESVYRHEVRVPLLIVPPGQSQPRQVVQDTVSLRDLPATIIDLVGLGAGATFPGRSLAHEWRGASSEGVRDTAGWALSELESPNPFDPNQGRSPAYRGPLVSLAKGGFAYIRNLRDGAEELFNEREDPGESSNQAEVESMEPVLKNFRRRLDLWRANPE
jgi:arylsulfatase A-like enzyme